MGEDFETEETPFDEVIRLDGTSWAFVRQMGDRVVVVRMVRNYRVTIRMNWGTTAEQG